MPQIYTFRHIISVGEMYEQEDSCIKQEDLMTEYMVYPEYDNIIPFQVA